MSGGTEDLPFRIELWDNADRRIEELIALAADYPSACGAYDEAVRRRPGKLITLRQKARVIKKSSAMDRKLYEEAIIEALRENGGQGLKWLLSELNGSEDEECRLLQKALIHHPSLRDLVLSD